MAEGERQGGIQKLRGGRLGGHAGKGETMRGKVEVQIEGFRTFEWLDWRGRVSPVPGRRGSKFSQALNPMRRDLDCGSSMSSRMAWNTTRN